MRPDEFTVLRAPGARMRKTVRMNRDGTIKIIDATHAFAFYRERIRFDREGKALRRLARREDCFIVLGEPDEDAWPEDKKRRRLARAREGVAPTLKDGLRGWMPVDVDTLEFEPICGIDDGEGLAIEVMHHLGLDTAHVVWQLTGSHGIENRTRLRLFVELLEPASCESMKAWATEHEVDRSIYRVTQPIYTAFPLFTEGARDPVGKEPRVGVVSGEPFDLAAAIGGLKRPRKADSDADDTESSNENLQKIREAGLYKRRMEPGKHAIQCPWEDEHTGKGGDGDAVFFEAGYNGKLTDAFKCLHSHCSERGVEDMRRKLGMSDFDEVVEVEGEEQPKWAYVHRLEMFWDAADGKLVKPRAFDTEHMAVQRRRRGTPTERFIADPKTLKVKDVAFLPGQPRVIERHGVGILNTYVDLRLAPGRAGAAPWEEHLRMLVPNRRAREWLCGWLAWCYQRPGDKIVTAPVLYGPEGTGKTTVFDTLGKCLGQPYVSKPTSSLLAEHFNGWAFQKLLMIVEELKSEDRYSLVEQLKPIITNPKIEIRLMRTDAFTVDNVVNVCACTNHILSLPLSAGDRRFVLIETAHDPQGKEATLKRLRKLHAWLDGEDGVAKVARWLNAYDLSGFNPMARAPASPLKTAVVKASQTQEELATELGFAAPDVRGFVSSEGLRAHLDRNELHGYPSKYFHVVARRLKWSWVGQENRGGRFVQVWHKALKPKDARAAWGKMNRGDQDSLLQQLADAGGEFRT